MNTDQTKVEQPSEEKILNALKNAHLAGDTKSATVLANYYKELYQTPVVAPEEPGIIDRSISAVQSFIQNDNPEIDAMTGADAGMPVKLDVQQTPQNRGRNNYTPRQPPEQQQGYQPQKYSQDLNVTSNPLDTIDPNKKLVSEMKSIPEPTLLDRMKQSVGGNKDAAMVEWKARQIAKDNNISVEEVYRQAGGMRPAFNPEGRPPLQATAEATNIVYQDLPKMIPGAANTVLRTIRGGNETVEDDWLDKAINYTQPEKPLNPDPNYDTLQGIGESLGYSISTMVSAITASALTTVATGNPAIGSGAGFAASGATAYRASKDQFLSDVKAKMDKASMFINGRRINQKEWDKALEEFETAAQKYGAWEAIPEAIGNLVFLRAFTKPLGQYGKGKLKEIAKRAASTLATENVTETATAVGQRNAEIEAGLSNEELSIAEAFKQQALPTSIVTGLMGGAGAAGKTGYNATKSTDRKVGELLSQEVDSQRLVSPEQNAIAALDPSNAQMEAIPAQRPSMGELVAQKLAERGIQPTQQPVEQQVTEPTIPMSPQASQEPINKEEPEKVEVSPQNQEATRPGKISTTELTPNLGGEALQQKADELAPQGMGEPLDKQRYEELDRNITAINNEKDTDKKISKTELLIKTIKKDTAISEDQKTKLIGKLESVTNKTEIQQSKPVSVQDDIEILGSVLRRVKNVGTKKEGNETIFTIDGNEVARTTNPPTIEEFIKKIGERIKIGMANGQYIAPTNPEKMTKDEFAIAYELAGIIPEFQFKSSEFDNLIKTGANGMFTVNVDELHNKILKQAEKTKKVEKPKAKQKKALTNKPQQTYLGKNKDNNPVYEDENGVRSYVENGIRVGEEVTVNPDNTRTMDNRGEQFYPVDENTVSENTPQSTREFTELQNAIVNVNEMIEGSEYQNSKVKAIIRRINNSDNLSDEQQGELLRQLPKIKNQEGNSNEPEKLEGKGEKPLEGTQTDNVSGNEEVGQTGNDATGSGRENISGSEPTGESGIPAGRSVSDGEGKLPVPERGRSGRDGVQQGISTDERSNEPNEPSASSRGSVGSITATEKAAESNETESATSRPAQTADKKPTKYFTLTKEMGIGDGGAKTKFKNNLLAIQTLKQINKEGRQATLEEQQTLAKYVGWGGIPQAFMGDGGKISKGWEKEAQQLKEALTEAEYDAARRSTQDAHYTSPEIVTEIWKAVKAMGFEGGRVLEPSVGTGNFIGFMPGGVRGKSQIIGVELDHITGGIAKNLYPGANIRSPVGFQEFTMPDNYFDLAIGNPPFGNQRLYDGQRKDLSKLSIHNYFFAKSMAGLKENGVLAMVVSSRLMDGNNQAARDKLTEQADLIGAIRLPNDEFLKNAGTQVTTDIIFLRKRKDGEQPNGEAWSNISHIKDSKGIDVPLNEYFERNPQMMLGEWGAFGSMYNANEPALVAKEGQDTNALLQKALATLPKGFMDKAGAEPVTEKVEIPTNIENVKVGSMFVDGDTISIRLEDQMGDARSEPVEMPNKKAEERIRSLIKIRDVFADLRKAQLSENVTEKALDVLRAKLNKVYDESYKKNGPINLDANKRLFRDDPTWPQLAALEDNFDKGISPAVAKKTGEKAKAPSAKKAAIFSKRTQQPYHAPTSAKTAKDALTTSLSEKGLVDMSYMVELYGKTENAIIAELGNLIFESSPGKFESRDEYLSGNVKAKLAQAKQLAKDDPIYLRNVEALKDVQPVDVESVDIQVKPGAHWLPTEVVTDFVNTILDTDNGKASFNPVNAKWNIQGVPTEASRKKYGTDRASVIDVLNAVANEKNIVIRDKINDTQTVINEAASNAANEKVERIKNEFRRWIWQNDDRRTKLTRLYNDTFNTDRLREYDGSHLTLPGKVGDDIIKLRPHQLSGVWRIVQSGTTLLDHVVGAGKTFTMIAGAMELRRTGKAKKPLFVVPNHLVSQWAEDFTKLYPNANILATTKNDFSKDNRKKLFARISTGDWDAVIVAHSSFGKVEMDSEFQEAFINQQIQDMDKAIETLRDQEGKGSRTVKQIEKQKERLTEKLKALYDSENKDDNIVFSELGVDALFLDEAHEYKNLAYVTSMTRVAGLGNAKGSKKAADMFMKVQSSLQRTGGNNIVFATGTPISNTMAEMYTMQRFLDYETLKDQGIAHFDAWAKMYGEVVTDWELSPTGKYKLNNRFSKFVNLPELMQRYLTFADVINRDDINRQLAAQGKVLPVPKIKGGKPQNIVVERSQDQAEYIGEPYTDENGKEQYPEGSLVYRSENIQKKPEKGADNMLKIMSDARKAALDMRLIDPSYEDNPNSKINVAADNIKNIYDKWDADKGTQLVFIDLSTPKGAKAKEANRIRDLINRAENGDEKAEEQLNKMSPDELTALDGDFSVYDDLRQKLINKGIPESEIEYIHSANTDLQKAELFAKVRSGRIRVLLGSTAKMGAGMNVQDRLVALHHMDAPWRPSDLEQREGRIIRQGNELYNRDPEGFEIEINRYATKQTLDSRMWQTIETKARFIEQVRKGNMKQREVEDVGGEASNSAEMKAASSGNPLVLEEMEVRQQLRKLGQAQEEHDREQFRIRDSIKKEQGIVEQGKKTLLKFAIDVKKAKAAPLKFTITVNGQNFTKHKEAGQTILKEAVKMSEAGTDTKKIGEYAGFPVILDNISGTRFILTLKGEMEHQLDIVDIKSADPTGLARKIVNTITNINGEYKELSDRVTEAENNIPKLNEQIGEWSKADELDKLKSKHTLIINKLKPKAEKLKQESDVSAMSVSVPMPNHRPMFGDVIPERPESGEIKIGNRTVKLKPEDKPTRREGIRVMVIDIIGARLYQNKIKGKDRLGFYRKSNSEVRIKDQDSVEVLAHEMAHYLDMHYEQKGRFTKAYKSKKEYTKEIQDLSYTSDDNLKTKEGFAEFVRLWLTQYDEAKTRAPLFTLKFEEVLAQDKKLNKKMQRLQEEMHRWLNQGDMARFYAVTSGNKYTPQQRATLLLAQRPGQYTRQRYIDKIHAAKVMGRTFNDGMMDANQDAYKQLQLLNGIEGITQESFIKGALYIDENGDIKFSGPSLHDVWNKSLIKSPEMLREQELYFIARRAEELKKQGRENLITDGMIEKGLALGVKHPHFVKAFEDYQEYRKNMMKFYVDSGYVTQEAADAMLEKNKNYVPFHRIVESVNDAYSPGRGFQRLKGGQQNIKPVFQNMMMQEQRHIYAALKAKAMQTLYSQALKDQNGSLFISKIAPDALPQKVDLTAMAEKTARAMADLGVQILDDGAITGSGETTVDMEDIKQYFMHNTEELMFWSFGHKPKTLETMVDSFIDENGKRIWVEIDKENKLLADMIDNMDYVALPEGLLGDAVKVAISVKNFQTLTITAAAQFIGPNIVRDTQQAFMLSGGRFRPFIDNLIGFGAQLYALLDKNSAYHEMKAQGGPSAGRVRTFYNQSWGLESDVAYDPRKSFYHPTQWHHALLDMYMSIADSAEIATRLGFYIRQRKIVGAREAAWQAREISTDFRKHGSYSAWVILQRTVPFLNAYIQSVDRDARAFSENKGEMKLSNLVKTESGRAKISDIKVRIWMASSLVVTVTAMLALLNDDEEEYQQLTPDQKTRFYHVFMEGKHYTAPKPHGLITLVAQGTEVAIDTMGRQRSDDAWKTMAFALGYHFGADAMPGILNPIAEIAVNRTFTGAPIVGQYKQKLDPEFQYTDRTPIIYVNAGRSLGISPDKAHHFVKGYTGYLSAYIDEISDRILWDEKVMGERPGKKTFADMVKKQFVPREVPYRTKYTIGYYELKKEAAAAKANLSFLLKSESIRNPGRIKDYASKQDKAVLMSLDQAFNKIDAELSNQSMIVSSIRYSKKLTAEEKDKRIENYDRQTNKLLSKFYEQARSSIDKINARLKEK